MSAGDIHTRDADKRIADLEQQLSALTDDLDAQLAQAMSVVKDREQQLAEQERLTDPLTVALYKEMSERHKAISLQLAESQASEKEWFRLSKELGGALASLRKAIEKHKHTIHEKCPEDALLWAALKEQGNG